MEDTEPTITEPTDAPAPAPETAPAETSPAPETQAPPVNVYALDADPEPATPPQEDGTPAYAIAWPDGFAPSEDFATLATTAAQNAGLDGAAAGAYTAAVWQQLQQLEQQKLADSDTAMRQEWGANFESNLASAKQMLRQLKAAGHVDDEAAQLLQSPKGMKLLHGLSSFVGERPAAGTQQPTPEASSWAHEVMSNPAHPDYKAFHNPSDPRWREVNTRYNTIRFGIK